MPDIAGQIDADLKTAMLARNELAVSVLRGLKSSLKNESIKKRADLNGPEIAAVIKRELKQREEAALVFEQGGALDRAEKERSEKPILEAYLPAMMPEAEVAKLVDGVILKIGKDPKNIGQIIGAAIAEAKGRADGGLVAKIVREKLN